MANGQTFIASGAGQWTTTTTGGTVGVTLNSTGTTGTVQLNPTSGTGSYGSGTNPLSVTAASGTLTGTATVLGSITINSGATISPGTSATSPGTLTVNASGSATGTATLSGGSTFAMNVIDGTPGSISTNVGPASAGQGQAGTGWNLLAANTLAVVNVTTTQVNVALTASGSIGWDPSKNYTWDFITMATGSSGISTGQFHLDTSAFNEPLNGGSFSLRGGPDDRRHQHRVCGRGLHSAVGARAGQHAASRSGPLGMAGMGWRQRRRRQQAETQQQEDDGGSVASKPQLDENTPLTLAAEAKGYRDCRRCRRTR